MPAPPRKYRRNSLRLKGFDYSQPGEYFVTICTENRACILGEVVDAAMRLSDAGQIAESQWKEIPTHFPHVRVEVFQIMPNHLHGIIEFSEHPNGIGRGLINQTPTGNEWILMKDPRITLGKIVRSFKAQCTKLIHDAGRREFAWQRNFYDHIIRDDVDYFFVEQYIRLNPILWDFDVNHPLPGHGSIDELRATLKEKHRLDDYAIERVVEHEAAYRNWYFVESGGTTGT